MGPYSIIYADPPLSFDVWGNSDKSKVKSPQNHYTTTSVPDLCKIPVSDWAADDAFLICWVYDPRLPDVFTLANAWGFDQWVTVLFRWLKSVNGQLQLFDPGEKVRLGTGYHTMGGGCEEAYLFRRGKGLPVRKRGIKKEFYSNIREHSRKPDEGPGWITDLYGDVPRLEMFARTQRLGWEVWGNETDKFEATRS